MPAIKARLTWALTLLSTSLSCVDESPVGDDDAATTTSPGDESDSSDESGESGDSSDESGETGEPDPEPICGDGVVAGEELCDDGNPIDDDGCSNACVPRACEVTWTHVDEVETLSFADSPDAVTPAFDELPNGDIVVAQLDDSGGLGDADVRLRVHTPAGAIVSETFVQFSPLRDQLGDILVDQSGDVFVAGAANVGIDGVATVVRSSGVDGSELWRFELDGEIEGAYDWASELAFDDQGRVLVAIMVTRAQGGRWIELHALDPMTGASEWTGTWLGEPDDADFATALVFDPVRVRTFVAVAENLGFEWWEPVVLAFEPPSEDPVWVATPLGDDVDAMPEFDVPLALTMSPGGRLWMASQETEQDDLYTRISELDPDDGSLIASFDLRDLGLGQHDNNAGMQSLHAGPTGGLVWAGFRFPDGGFESNLVALDDDAALDCVVGFELPELYTVFAASDGGLYTGGIQPVSNNRHGVVVRVR